MDKEDKTAGEKLLEKVYNMSPSELTEYLSEPVIEGITKDSFFSLDDQEKSKFVVSLRDIHRESDIKNERAAEEDKKRYVLAYESIKDILSDIIPQQYDYED